MQPSNDNEVNNKPILNLVLLTLGIFLLVITIAIFVLTMDFFALVPLVFSVALILVSRLNFKGKKKIELNETEVKQLKNLNTIVLVSFFGLLLIVFSAVFISLRFTNNSANNNKDEVKTFTTSPEPLITTLADWGITGTLPNELFAHEITLDNETTARIESDLLSSRIKFIGCGDYCNVPDTVVVANITRSDSPLDAYGQRLEGPLPDTVRIIGNKYYTLTLAGNPPSSPTAKELQAIDLQKTYGIASTTFFDSLRLVDNSDYLNIPEWDISIGVGQYSEKLNIDTPSSEENGESYINVRIKKEFSSYEDCPDYFGIKRTNKINLKAKSIIKDASYYYYVMGTSECGGTKLSTNKEVITSRDVINSFELLGVRY